MNKVSKKSLDIPKTKDNLQQSSVTSEEDSPKGGISKNKSKKGSKNNKRKQVVRAQGIVSKNVGDTNKSGNFNKNPLQNNSEKHVESHLQGSPEKQVESRLQNSSKENIEGRLQGSKEKTLSNHKLSKKQLILVITFAVVIFLGIGLAIYFIFFYSNNPNPDPKGDYSTLIRKEYSYAIDISDNEGFIIDSSWLGDVDIKDIRQVVKSGNIVAIDDNFRMTFVQDGEFRKGGYAQEIEYYYDTKLISKISVESTEGGIIIRNKSDLSKILPGTKKIFIQVEDIDLEGDSLEITNFNGKFYGNHKKISNLVLSENGGLFITPSDALISSVVLENVQADITYSGTKLYVGALANKITNTEISYCLATGKIAIQTENKEGYLAVGGLVGEASSEKRVRNLDVTNKLANSQTNIDLNVSGGGKFLIGGVVGVSQNVTVNECYSLGKIDLNIVNGADLAGVVLGGVVGSLTKEYEVSLLDIKGLDSATRLHCYSGINVEVNGGGDGIIIVVGGVYGNLENHSVSNSSYNGKMDVKTGSWSMRLGGFAGQATCNVSLLPMEIKGVSTKNSKINISSKGEVFSGGLVGRINDVDYSNKNEGIIPTIENTATNPTERVQVANTFIGYEES